MGTEDVPEQPLAMIVAGNFTPVPTVIGSTLVRSARVAFSRLWLRRPRLSLVGHIIVLLGGRRAVCLRRHHRGSAR